MTHNNISFLELLERKRSNLAQEAETKRANLAKEEYNYYSTGKDVETRLLVAGMSKEASITAAQTSAGASMYNARLNAETSRYNAELNAETSRYTTDQNVGQAIEDRSLRAMQSTAEYDYKYDALEAENWYRQNQIDIGGINANANYANAQTKRFAAIAGAIRGLGEGLLGILAD